MSKIDNCNVALAGLRSVTLIGFSPCWTLHDSQLMRASSTMWHHWLRVPERIQYKLCVLVHHCHNGAAPQYLPELIQPLSDVGGDRAFTIAGPRAWNNLPVDLRLSRIFTIFKTHLKSHLFNLSFPSVWLYYWLHHWLFLYRALEVACAAYASLNLSLLHYITLH